MNVASRPYEYFKIFVKVHADLQRMFVQICSEISATPVFAQRIPAGCFRSSFNPLIPIELRVEIHPISA